MIAGTASQTLRAAAARPGIWLGRLATAIVVLTLLAAVALATIIGSDGWLAGRQFSAEAGELEIVVGDDVLLVPANAIRFRTQRRGGSQRQIDLHLKWPELSGYRTADDKVFRGEHASPDLVLVTIAPRTVRLDMSGRIEPIYARFFDGPPVPAGYGLVKRPLSASAGFTDEDLYFEQDSPYPFAARCIRAETVAATPYCLRDIHVGRNLAVAYRFHIARIGDWMAIEAALRARLHAMLRD